MSDVRFSFGLLLLVAILGSNAVTSRHVLGHFAFYLLWEGGLTIARYQLAFSLGMESSFIRFKLLILLFIYFSKKRSML